MGLVNYIYQKDSNQSSPVYCSVITIVCQINMILNEWLYYCTVDNLFIALFGVVIIVRIVRWTLYESNTITTNLRVIIQDRIVSYS